MEILIVEDNKGVREGMEKLLRKKGYKDIVTSVDGLHALEMIKKNPRIDFLILDWGIPGIDGVELMSRVRSIKNRNFYILFVTASGGVDNLKTVIENGADDFISKPFEPTEFLARILSGKRVLEVLKNEHRQTRKLFYLNIKMKRLNSRLDSLAGKDALTGLYNRRGLEKNFRKRFEAQGGRRSTKRMSIIALDVDDFKSVNDTNGHDVGDKLLRFVANSIRSVVRDDAIVGRWGGDEFIVVLFETAHEAVRISERIVKEVGVKSFTSTGLEVYLSAGVSSGEGKSFEELYVCADVALRTAKSCGKNGVSTNHI